MHPASTNYKIRGVTEQQLSEIMIIFVTRCLLFWIAFLVFNKIVYKSVNGTAPVIPQDSLTVRGWDACVLGPHKTI